MDRPRVSPPPFVFWKGRKRASIATLAVRNVEWSRVVFVDRPAVASGLALSTYCGEVERAGWRDTGHTAPVLASVGDGDTGFWFRGDMESVSPYHHRSSCWARRRGASCDLTAESAGPWSMHCIRVVVVVGEDVWDEVMQRRGSDMCWPRSTKRRPVVHVQAGKCFSRRHARRVDEAREAQNCFLAFRILQGPRSHLRAVLRCPDSARKQRRQGWMGWDDLRVDGVIRTGTFCLPASIFGSFRFYFAPRA